MTWILLALAAHAGNALVFVVDKSLLGNKQSAISDPLKYALYSGLLAAAAVILLPFAASPLTPLLFHWSLLAGIFHLGALYFFFRALKNGEPSRVVPLVGSVVPLATLILAALSGAEALTAKQYLAVGILMAGGALLSLGLPREGRLRRPKWGEVLLSGVLFAAYFVTVNYLYDHTPLFLATFAWSRVVEGVIAGMILILLSLYRERVGVRVKGQSLHRPSSYPSPYSGRRDTAIFIANKILAAGAFLLQSYALSLGSVTVVNSLQGTQYVFLLILAAAVSSWFPKLFREEFSRVALGQKIAGIALISLGVALLV